MWVCRKNLVLAPPQRRPELEKASLELLLFPFLDSNPVSLLLTHPASNPLEPSTLDLIYPVFLEDNRALEERTCLPQFLSYDCQNFWWNWTVVISRGCWYAFTCKKLTLKFGKFGKFGASLVAQWLRICLPTQGTRVRALVWEDPTCLETTRPVSHNYWACASGACAPQQEGPRQWEARAQRWRVAPARRK